MAKLLILITCMLSAYAVRQQEASLIDSEADSNIRPDRDLRKVLGDADSKAKAKEQRAKTNAAAAELALMNAKLAQEQEAAGKEEVGGAEDEFENAKKRHEEAIAQADAAYEAAQETAEKQKAAAMKVLDAVSTKANEASKEVAKYQGFVAARLREEAETLPGLLKQVKDATQRIESMRAYTAKHKGLLQLAKQKEEEVKKKLETTEAKHNQTVKDAIAKVNEVEEDWEAKVDAAKAALDAAEAELMDLEDAHGGEATVTTVAENMVKESEKAKARADREYAAAVASKAAVHSFQHEMDILYIDLTKTENVFHRKLRSVLTAADTTKAKAESTGKMKDVKTEEVIDLGKKIYAAMDDFTTTGGVIIKDDDADLKAAISDGLAKIGATVDEMMLPVCKWYAITHGVDEPGASACELFKSEQM